MIYAVEVKYVGMIEATTPKEAISKARHLARDIVNDSPDASIATVLSEIHAIDELKKFGWDGQCLPYGRAGNETLKDILSPK